MTKPIDREKLLAWLEQRIKEAKYGKEAQAFADVREEIQSGAFDIEPEPMPDLKPGDRVGICDGSASD